MVNLIACDKCMIFSKVCCALLCSNSIIAVKSLFYDDICLYEYFL